MCQCSGFCRVSDRLNDDAGDVVAGAPLLCRFDDLLSGLLRIVDRSQQIGDRGRVLVRLNGRDRDPAGGQSGNAGL